MKIVSWCPFAEREIAVGLRGLVDTVVVHVNTFEQLQREIEDADGLLIPGSGNLYDESVSQLLQSRAKSLKWIQCLTSGYESLVRFGTPFGVPVTSAGGSNAKGVAEHGMSLLLALIRRIPAIVANQHNGEWSASLSGEVDSLEGKTVAIVGLGSVGRAFANLAKAFDMHTIGVNRSRIDSPHIDTFRGYAELDVALTDCDVAVLALALNEDTHHLMNSRRLARIGPNGYLINLGRGALVDCSVLDASLREGTLKAAAIDVTDPEPLPSQHPLWRNPRILISPHLGGYGHPTSFARLADVVRHNAHIVLQGASLRNEIAIPPTTRDPAVRYER